VNIIIGVFSVSTAAKDTLTLTAMDADTSNRSDIPDKMGLFEYNVKFVPGGSTTAYALG